MKSNYGKIYFHDVLCFYILYGKITELLFPKLFLDSLIFYFTCIRQKYLIMSINIM